MFELINPSNSKLTLERGRNLFGNQPEISDEPTTLTQNHRFVRTFRRARIKCFWPFQNFNFRKITFESVCFEKQCPPPCILRLVSGAGVFCGPSTCVLCAKKRHMFHRHPQLVISAGRDKLKWICDGGAPAEGGAASLGRLIKFSQLLPPHESGVISLQNKNILRENKQVMGMLISRL